MSILQADAHRSAAEFEENLKRAVDVPSPTIQQWAQAQVYLALRSGVDAAALQQPAAAAGDTPAELPAALSAAVKMLLQNMAESARKHAMGLLAALIARNAPGTAGAVGAVLRQLPCSLGDAHPCLGWLRSLLVALEVQSCAWLHAQTNLCALLGVWAATHLSAMSAEHNPSTAALLQHALRVSMPHSAAFAKGGAALLRALPAVAAAAAAATPAAELWQRTREEIGTLQPPELASHTMCAAKTPKMFVASCVPPHVETALVHTLKSCPSAPGAQMDAALRELREAYTCSSWNSGTPAPDAFVVHLLRYLVVALHPSAEQIRAPTIKRWSLAAWLLCGGLRGDDVQLPSDKLLDAVFWDVWVFRPKRNIMLIEPAVLLLAGCAGSVAAPPHSCPPWVSPALSKHIAQYMWRCLSSEHLQIRHAVAPGAAAASATAALQAALHMRVLRSASQLSAVAVDDVQLYSALQQKLPKVLPASPAAPPPPNTPPAAAASPGASSTSAQKRHRDGTPVSQTSDDAPDEAPPSLGGGGAGAGHRWAAGAVASLLQACQRYSGTVFGAGSGSGGTPFKAFAPDVALSVLVPFLEQHLGAPSGGRPTDTLQALQLTAAELAGMASSWLWDPSTWLPSVASGADSPTPVSVLAVHGATCADAVSAASTAKEAFAPHAVLFLVEVLLFAVTRSGASAGGAPPSLAAIDAGAVSVATPSLAQNTCALIGSFLGCLDTECTLDRALKWQGGEGGGSAGVLPLLLLHASSCGVRFGAFHDAMRWVDAAEGVQGGLKSAMSAAAAMDMLHTLLGDEGVQGGSPHSIHRWVCWHIAPALLAADVAAGRGQVGPSMCGQPWWGTALVRSMGPGVPLPQKPTVQCTLPGGQTVDAPAVLFSLLPPAAPGAGASPALPAQAAANAARELLQAADTEPSAARGATAAAALRLGVLLLRTVHGGADAACAAALGALRGAASQHGGAIAAAATALSDLGVF